MSHYESPQNNLRNRYARPSLPMDDMPYKPGMSPEEIAEGARREWEEEQKKRARRRTAKPPSQRKPTATRRTSGTFRAQTAKTAKRPVKRLPPLGSKQAVQPRDRLGRFASKVWAGTKMAVKGTARVVGGAVKTARKAHKTIKRAHKAGQRRARLEERERRIALAERKKKLGLRKKVVRRRKR
jgi:hypothetical protein